MNSTVLEDNAIESELLKGKRALKRNSILRQGIPGFFELIFKKHEVKQNYPLLANMNAFLFRMGGFPSYWLSERTVWPVDCNLIAEVKKI